MLGEHGHTLCQYREYALKSIIERAAFYCSADDLSHAYFIYVIDGQTLVSRTLHTGVFQSPSTEDGLRWIDPTNWNALPDSLVLRFNDENATLLYPYLAVSPNHLSNPGSMAD